MTVSSPPAMIHPVLGRLRRLGTVTVISTAFPVGLVFVWALASRAHLVSDQILPNPAIIWQSFVDQIEDGSLLRHTEVSLWRVAVGFLAGIVFGLPIGALLGVSGTVRVFVGPILQAITQVNAMAWIPVLVMFLGIDEALKTVIIGWTASTPIILGTQRGISDVSPRFRELGRALDLSWVDTLRLIIVPASLPSIFTGLREGLANAWQTLVIVELFASFEGLGYLMAWGRQLFQLELVIVAMIVIGAIGLVLNSLLGWLERLVQPWAAGVRA